MGDGSLLNLAPAVAIVGSREIGAAERNAAAKLAGQSVREGCAVVSGAAKGSDEEAMLAALEAGGNVIGAIADNLLRVTSFRPYREAIEAQRMVLASACGVETRFSVANAMARNKYIYALADRTIVIASTKNKGGTWTGAVEALERGWDVIVRKGTPMSPGNTGLIELGARIMDDSGAIVDAGKLPSNDDAQELWCVVRDRLNRMPDSRRGCHDVAATFDVLPLQAEQWIERFNAERLAQPDPAPRTCVERNGKQLPLIDCDSTAKRAELPATIV